MFGIVDQKDCVDLEFRGRNSLLVVWLAVLLDAVSLVRSSEEIFPVEVLTPFPQNSFGWEYRLWSSLCTHVFYRSSMS